MHTTCRYSAALNSKISPHHRNTAQRLKQRSKEPQSTKSNAKAKATVRKETKKPKRNPTQRQHEGIENQRSNKASWRRKTFVFPWRFWRLGERYSGPYQNSDQYSAKPSVSIAIKPNREAIWTFVREAFLPEEVYPRAPQVHW